MEREGQGGSGVNAAALHYIMQPMAARGGGAGEGGGTPYESHMMVIQRQSSS